MAKIITNIDDMLKNFPNNSLLNTIVIGLIALTVSVSGCSPEATTTLDKIKEKDKITIGVKTDYAPFGFIDAKGNNAGLEIDIARYLSLELLGSPDKIEFVPVVAANRIGFLQQGKIDLVIATMTDTEERRQVIDFSEHYYASGTGLLTRKDSGVRTWDDLKGKKVCGIQGSFYNKDLTEKGIEMVNFPGTAEAYKALQEGRCIGFAYDDSALVGKLLEPEWANDWQQGLPPILSQPWGMGIRKGDSAFLEKVNQAIIKLEAEGVIVEGEKKWQIPPTTYAQKRMEQAKAKLKPETETTQN
jgi:polar amino acid transport system substrate-binding protein